MNAEVDARNDWGFPPIEVTAQERANQTTQIDQSVNKALPYVAWSWLLSGLALGGLLLLALLLPALIDSKVSAGVADAKAAMAQQTAQSNETANAARMFGRLANEKSDRVLAQLEARGLVKQENH